MTLALCIVDTEAYALANNAIENTRQILDFNNVLVFTDQTTFWKNCNIKKIDKINNIEKYNEIILTVLPNYVQEDFVIIAQYDGFAINKYAFSDIFFEYDYIGAVWNNFETYTVGNGGFSLRSKKLLALVSEYAHLRKTGEAEDVFICRTLRPMLEIRHSIKFAPENIAHKFSFEFGVIQYDCFGFHGVFNLPLVYENNLEFLFSNLPKRVLLNSMGSLLYGISKLTVESQLFAQDQLQRAVDKYRFE